MSDHAVWSQVRAEMEDFPARVRELPVARRESSPVRLRDELENRYTFEQPVPLESVVADVSRLLRSSSVHVTHPRYFGLFNPSVRTAGVVAEALAALYNPQLAVWSHAPAAQELERLTLRRLGAVLGLDPDRTFANFTTGGAEANLSAVLAALAHRFPEAGSAGLAGLSARPAIYLTDESHHSFVKIARMSGLGTGSLREVRTTGGFAMDVDALADRLRADVRAGWKPLLIVGTAGTTATGAIDPLPALAELAREHGAWLHVDAAWGASAALVPRLRGALDGIEKADSITWDAHKWLSVPMGAGMLFCRHPDAVRRAFAISASYMPPAQDAETADPYATTVQWSRRAIGLKLFMSLAELGLSGYGELIDRQARVGDLLRERLAGEGWVVLDPGPLPVVCFTHPEIRRRAASTGGVLAELYERGRVWISDVAPRGSERMLRACITSFRTDESDIDCLIQELERALRRASSRSGRAETAR